MPMPSANCTHRARQREPQCLGRYVSVISSSSGEVRTLNKLTTSGVGGVDVVFGDDIARKMREARTSI